MSMLVISVKSGVKRDDFCSDGWCMGKVALGKLAICHYGYWLGSEAEAQVVFFHFPRTQFSV